MTATQTATTSPRRLAVLGAGPIGRTVGAYWVRAGHQVTFGVRSPEKLDEFVAELGPRARAGTLAQAAQQGDVVLNALLYTAVEEVLAAVGDDLAGKIVIDASNPMALSAQGRIVSTLDAGVTAGEYTAGLLPRSTVVRTFTHVMDETLAYRGTFQPHFWAMALAGDDAPAKAIVTELVHATGFTPVDIGTLADSAPLDPGGALFPHTFTAADLRAAVAVPTPA